MSPATTSPIYFGDKFPDLRSVIELFFKETRDFQGSVAKLAAVVFVILFAIELIKEAINLASGRGFNLDKKLLALIVIGIAMTVFYGSGSKMMYVDVGIGIVDQQLLVLKASQDQLLDHVRRLFFSNSFFEMLPFFVGPGMMLNLVKILGYLVILLVMLILHIMIILIVLGTFAGYAMVLHVGPLFIVFFVLEETRQWFFTWLSHIVSFLVQIIFLGLALQVGSALMQGSVSASRRLLPFDLVGYGKVFFAAINGPLMTIGLLMVALRVARSLTGAGGGAELLGPFGAAYGMMAKQAVSTVSSAANSVKSAAGKAVGM